MQRLFVGLCSVFLSLFLSAQEQDSTKIKVPAELLFKEIPQYNYRISPDGKTFLEILETNGSYELITIDIDKYSLKTRIPLGDNYVYDLNWISNDRVVYGSLGHIYAINIDGTEKVTLVDRRPTKPKKNVYAWHKNFRLNTIKTILPNNPEEILVSTIDYEAHATLKRVNIFTGQQIVVISGTKDKVNDWIVDRDGKPIMGVRADEEGIEYLIQNRRTMNWEPFELFLGGASHILQYVGSSALEQNLTLEGIGFNPGEIYITSNINSDKRKLLLYNYQNGQVLDTLISNPNVDVGDPGNGDLDLVFDYKNKELGFIEYDGFLPQRQPVNDDFRDLKTKLDKTFPGKIHDIIDADDDNNRFVVYQWNDTYAGNIGIFDRSSGQYFLMFHFNEELNEYALSSTRFLGLKNREGVRLPSYLNLPKVKSDSYPLVMIPHGGPWARDSFVLEGYAQFFASQGYAVLRVNYQGSTGFGKQHVRSGVQGIHTVMIDDIIDATKEVMEKFPIDQERVFIFGHSYGGYAAYMSLIRYPEFFRAGVAIAAPTDIREWLKIQRKEDNTFAFEYWEGALGKKSKSYYQEISPIFQVDKINTPLRIFHGRYDDIIPVEQAELMGEALEAKNKPAELTIMEFLGHSIENSSSLGYLLDQSHAFFQKNSQ